MQGSLSQFGAAIVLAVGLFAPAGAAEDSLARWQRAADDYARLDPLEQERWVQELFGRRSEPACRVTMAVKELARQQARHRAIESHLRAGRELSTMGVIKLLEEVDAQEQAAIDRLWRDYEFGLARAYNANRAEFEEGMAAGRRLRENWEKAGRPWNKQATLIGWLKNAIAYHELAERKNAAPLPAVVREMGPDPLIARPGEPTAAPRKQPTQPQPRRTTFRESPALGAAETPGPTRRSSTSGSTTERPSVEKPPLLARSPSAAKVVVPPVAVEQPPAQRQLAAAKTSALSAGPKIDLAELGVRIAGYNLARADLIARLHEQQSWEPGQLDEAVDTLAQLVLLRKDLSLYWNLLSPEAHQTMQPIESIATAVSLLAAKTAATRKRLDDRAEDESLGDRQSELHALDRVSRRLAELVAEQP